MHLQCAERLQRTPVSVKSKIGRMNSKKQKSAAGPRGVNHAPAVHGSLTRSSPTSSAATGRHHARRHHGGAPTLNLPPASDAQSFAAEKKAVVDLATAQLAGLKADSEAAWRHVMGPSAVRCIAALQCSVCDKALLLKWSSTGYLAGMPFLACSTYHKTKCPNIVDRKIFMRFMGVSI